MWRQNPSLCWPGRRVARKAFAEGLLRVVGLALDFIGYAERIGNFGIVAVECERCSERLDHTLPAILIGFEHAQAEMDLGVVWVQTQRVLVCVPRPVELLQLEVEGTRLLYVSTIFGSNSTARR